MQKNHLTKISENVSAGVCGGDLGFGRFLEQGGASDEDEIFAFLSEMTNAPDGLRFSVDGTGCSTMQAKGQNGYYFGRNFDWGDCRILILSSCPETGTLPSAVWIRISSPSPAVICRTILFCSRHITRRSTA
jgi:hypothetical protein